MSWFDRLRRDRALFAIVGSLALLVSAMQPAAAARASGFSPFLVLCSNMHGDWSGNPKPTQLPDCPLCPTGHLCGLQMVSGVPVQDAFFIPFILRKTPPDRSRFIDFLADSGIEDHPSIRGPPPIKVTEIANPVISVKIGRGTKNA